MPSIRGTPTITTSGSSSSLVLSVPSGVRPGDSLIVGMGIDVVTTVSPPAGWTRLVRVNDTAAGNDQTLEAYIRLVTGGEASTYTWTLGAAQAYAAGMATVQDALQNSTPHDWDSQQNAASVTGTAPSLLTRVPNCLLIGMFASDISPSAAITTTSGMTSEIVDVNTGTWANFAMYTEVVAAAGLTGTRTCTFSAASNGSMGALFAFAPYVAPRPPRPSLIHLLDDEDWSHFSELDARNWF